MCFRSCPSSWGHTHKTRSSSPSAGWFLRFCTGSGPVPSGCDEACSISPLSSCRSVWAGTSSGYGSQNATVELDVFPSVCGYRSVLSVRKTMDSWHQTSSEPLQRDWQNGLNLVSDEGPLVAWADFTDSRLCHQFALAVTVADPRGHTSATGFGAGRPGRGLQHTLDSFVTHWVAPENCTEGNRRDSSVCENFSSFSLVSQSHQSHQVKTLLLLPSQASAHSPDGGRPRVRRRRRACHSSVPSPSLAQAWNNPVWATGACEDTGRNIQRRHPCTYTGVCSLDGRFLRFGKSYCCTHMFFHPVSLV